jgi:H+/Cl- antiporter ClcA
MNFLYNDFKENTNLFKNFIKWFMLSILSGIIIGIVISLFLKSLQFATSTRQSYPVIILLLPFGGALVSYLYLRYGKDSSKGNNLIIERINKGEANIPFRMAPLVFFGTFITHLFGGSAGREGTGVQIGASICSKLSKILKLNEKDTTMIIISGVSSGFGVVFGTPIAGTIFGLEVSTVGKMRYEAIIPCLISSFIGNSIAKALKVHHSHYVMEVVSSSDYSIFYKVILLRSFIICLICISSS